MDYIFLAKLENDKYFVGTTINIEQKIENITEIDWTKKYKPIEFILFIPNSNDIDKYVIYYMQKYGINNVRGGTLSDILLNSENIENLKKQKYSTDKCYICGNKNHIVNDCKSKETICSCILSYFIVHYTTTCNMYKPLYNNEDDIIEQLKPITEAVSEVFVETITEPVTEAIIEPIVESVTEAIVEVEPITEPVTVHDVEAESVTVVEPIKTITEFITEPIIDPIAKPNTESIIESIIEPIKPIIEDNNSLKKYFYDSTDTFYSNYNKINDKKKFDIINDKLLDDLLTTLVKNNSSLDNNKKLSIDKMPTLEPVLYTPPLNIKKNNYLDNRMPVYLKLVNNVCSRCGRTNHKTIVCHAIKHIKGYYL
jgi:hypothetical protein